MPADSSENLQLSQRTDGPEPAITARDLSLQSTKGIYRKRGTCDTKKVPLHYRINQFPNPLTRINGFWLKEMSLDLFAMVFEEHSFFKKRSIIGRNEHNFSIIWPKKWAECYWHNMLLLLARSISDPHTIQAQSKFRQIHKHFSTSNYIFFPFLIPYWSFHWMYCKERKRATNIW